MKNAATIDLEDYYQVSAFSQEAAVAQWDSFASRIEQNTHKLLSIFDQKGVRATFFSLGWIAKKYPKLIREIADQHHEIACHSNIHRSVYTLRAGEFREDTLQAKQLLEDVVGVPVLGYRAPSFSIKGNSLWAYEVLAELGFSYDSSVFPISHPNYGWPQAPRSPFGIRTRCGLIVEFPMPTLQLGGARAPIGGGAYLRLLPYWYTRWGISYLNKKEELPACVYLHPWELDFEQPRIQTSLSARLRHYLGLRSAESKLHRLLDDFEMMPLGALIEELKTLSANGRKRMQEVDFAQLAAYLGG